MGRSGFEPPTHGFSVRCSGCKWGIDNRLQRIFEPKTRIPSGYQVTNEKRRDFKSGLPLATDTFTDTVLSLTSYLIGIL